jgi:hypothetical protein
MFYMGVKVDLSPCGKNIQKVFERHLPEENTWIQDTDSETRMEKNYIISTLMRQVAGT